MASKKVINTSKLLQIFTQGPFNVHIYSGQHIDIICAERSCLPRQMLLYIVVNSYSGG